MRDRQTLESVMMKDESKKRKISTYRSYESETNLGTWDDEEICKTKKTY